MLDILQRTGSFHPANSHPVQMPIMYFSLRTTSRLSMLKQHLPWYLVIPRDLGKCPAHSRGLKIDRISDRVKVTDSEIWSPHMPSEGSNITSPTWWRGLIEKLDVTMHQKWMQKQYARVVIIINIIVVSHSKILIFMFTEGCCILFCLKPEHIIYQFLTCALFCESLASRPL